MVRHCVCGFELRHSQCWSGSHRWQAAGQQVDHSPFDLQRSLFSMLGDFMMCDRRLSDVMFNDLMLCDLLLSDLLHIRILKLRISEPLSTKLHLIIVRHNKFMQLWWFGTAYVVPNWGIFAEGARAIADKLPDSKLTTLDLLSNGRFSACWVTSWCAIEERSDV